MSQIRYVSLFAVACMVMAPVLATAKSSDRSKPMNIDAGGQEGTFEGTGSTVYTGGIIVQQGTLDIRADRGELVMRDGDITRVVFTGAPAIMKQQLEDGSPMTASARRIDYDMASEVVTFTGSYKVSSPKGSNSGQKMVYNLRTGNMQGGGDGTRVRTVIQPRQQAAPKAKGAN